MQPHQQCIRDATIPCVFQKECGICPQHIINELDLWKIAAADPEVTLAITITLAANDNLVKNYIDGQTKAIDALLGKLMTATRGRVDPQELMKELKETLEVYRRYL
jgi:Asp-tRNA(Asn)/Glu-tRNA(Gln) amidotransferase B subunit